MTSPNERTGCRRLRDGTTTESVDSVAGCDECSATSRAKKSSSRCTSSSDISSIDRRGLADAGLRVSGDNMPADPAAWTTGADQAPSGERPALLGLRVGVRAPHSPCLMRPSTVCTVSSLEARRAYMYGDRSMARCARGSRLALHKAPHEEHGARQGARAGSSAPRLPLRRPQLTAPRRRRPPRLLQFIATTEHSKKTHRQTT